jgi:hypothetical protein
MALLMNDHFRGFRQQDGGIARQDIGVEHGGRGREATKPAIRASATKKLCTLFMVADAGLSSS